MAREIQRIGYLLTWTMELLLDKPAQARSIFAEDAACGYESIAKLPVFPLGRRITMIQVESLDYSAVTMLSKGKTVAPVLSAMAKEALWLEMDGTKRLASARAF